MGPEHVPIRNGLFELCVVSAETLREAPLPIASPLHSHKVIWRRQDEKNCKQDVVKNTQTAIPHLRRNYLKKRRFSNAIPHPWGAPGAPGASCYRHQIAARPESERCIHAADMGQTQVAAG